MKLPPTRTDAREKAALFFWHGTCAAHEKASPSLHAARTLDVRRSTSCRRKCQHTGVPVLEEDRVLGGGRAPGVRVCPDTDVPGHCGADPIQWQSYRPACVFGRVLCALWGTVFPGQGEQDTQRGQKGHCPVLGSCFGGLVLRLCRFGVIPPRKRVRQCRRRICAYPQKSAVGLRGQGVSVSLCLRGNPASPDVGARGPYPDRGTCRSRGGSPLPGMSPMPPRRIPAA